MNLEKRYLTILGALVASFALGASSPARAGGVDGGGGNLLPSEHVSVADIGQIIRDGKRDLRMYVRGLEWSSSLSPLSPLGQKLFGSAGSTLVEVLENTPIDVRETEPCYDENHVETDGSVYGSAPGSICISAFRIAPKLVPERARGETLALVLHELSHKLSATEDEAVSLQKPTSVVFRSIDAKWYGKVALAISNVGSLFHFGFDEMRLDSIGYADRYRDDYGYAFVMDPSEAIYTRAQFDYYVVQVLRLELLLQYADAKKNPVQKKDYDELFGHADAVSLGDMIQKRGLDTLYDKGVAAGNPEVDAIYRDIVHNRYLSQPMRKIHDDQELNQQLNEQASYWQEQFAYYRALYQNLPVLPALQLPH
jgi:hypothetical protein